MAHLITQPLIRTEVSAEELRFVPGVPTVFTVTVFNQSDRFASFQLELSAAGVGAESADWYSLSPEVCSKQPPGDVTQFVVTILHTPVPRFAGMVNLTVRVFSMELQAEERNVLRLMVEPSLEAFALEASLPKASFQAYPGDRLSIPVRVYNPTRQLVYAQLQLTGTPQAWLTDDSETTLKILPGRTAETSYACQLPPLTKALHQHYPFEIKIAHANGTPSAVAGDIEILPQGAVTLRCTPDRQQIPPKRAWLPGTKATSAPFSLEFENVSNVPQQIGAVVHIAGEQSSQQSSQPASSDKATQGWALTLVPEQAELPSGSRDRLRLNVTAHRPLLGLGYRRSLEITGTISDPAIELQDSVKPAELQVLPLTPRWLQATGGLLLLLGLAWIWALLNQVSPHRAAVNAVAINGLADRIVSGSDDQTVRDWRIDGDRLRSIGEPESAGKSVRTLQYRPVDNNQLAIGLENGEIELWNLLSDRNKPVRSVSFRKDDRVMGLAFTRSSDLLFSGHGSGLVLQWNVGQDVSPIDRDQPMHTKQFDFAVYDLTVVGSHEDTLAIAGRYNQLVLWSWQTDKQIILPYRAGGQDDYITSLSTSEADPYQLATADNQGYISLWNLRPCLTGSGVCQLVDQWSGGTANQPVRSVALSPDSCQLVSAGDDGQLRLWALTGDGKHSGRDSKTIAQFPTKLNSVAIASVNKDLLIATGADDHQVRLQRIPADHSICRNP
jgi:WD40 repeat protein